MNILKKLALLALAYVLIPSASQAMASDNVICPSSPMRVVQNINNLDEATKEKIRRYVFANGEKLDIFDSKKEYERREPMFQEASGGSFAYYVCSKELFYALFPTPEVRKNAFPDLDEEILHFDSGPGYPIPLILEGINTGRLCPRITLALDETVVYY